MSLETRLAAVLDSDWYAKTYPNFAGDGHDAVKHYLQYGLQQGHAPSASIDLQFHADMHNLTATQTRLDVLMHLLDAPDQTQQGRLARADVTRLPWALDRLARRGRGNLALRIAGETLPADMQPFAHILGANHALRSGDQMGWLTALNAYLQGYGAAPISLHPRAAGPLGACAAPITKPVADGPLVSVIMSTWQSDATLADSLNSLLLQGWRALEVIVVDDASTDRTGAILADISARDARVKVLRNPVNVGPYVGRNLALSVAKGDYICCHDADEWAHPDRIATHMAWVLTQNRAPVSQIGMLRMAPSGQITQMGRARSHTVDGALRPCPSGTMFRADFLRETLGHWQCARFGADTELNTRAALATGKPIPMLKCPLVLSLDHPNSLTNRKDTGMGAAGTGMSAARKAYQTYRANRLAALQNLGAAAQKHALFCAFPPTDYTDIPASVAVPRGAIDLCIQRV